jgi:single-strand DNA-binding protein
MPSLNRVQLIGRLGKDPETRFIPSGQKVTSFSLAVDRRWKTGSDEVKKVTDWFNIEAWGHLGEICQKFLHKGRLVFLEGRLQTDRYEDKGEMRYFTKVVARQVQILDWPAEKEEQEPEVPVEEDPPLEE